MTIEETYNIHKKISCIFPKFKSKKLCQKGIHNYHIYSQKKDEPERIEFNPFGAQIVYDTVYVSYWKCACCGKIEEVK